MKEHCYHRVTNVFQLIFLGKMCCEACCGGAKKWDAMFFSCRSLLLSTIVLNDYLLFDK